ncbi:hypothetical protein RSO01_91940 [Reyranella soli]|uniref:Uncharacterized protein n=1 Tax=Reyranella soli TaxID=1230389 RepID=A0A512NSV4_9HYPH|nr:hypothetical protein RSO01_91940 [Reyranella soli]
MMLGGAIGTGEQSVLARERKWADRPFDDVAIDLDATVIDEQAQSLPA